MTRKLSISLFAVLILFFASCQKVINVDLNNANPNYVVEGVLFNGINDFKVKITKTTNYFGIENPPVVNDAVVYLVPSGGTAIAVPFVANGEYVLPNFDAATEKSYDLQVLVGGKTFTSTAYMPKVTEMDSLSYQEFQGFGGGGSGDRYLMKAHFQDSVGLANYYRVNITKNDTFINKPSDYYLFDDKLRDGQYIDAPLFTSFFRLGDTADIQLLSMDAGVFDYLITLEEIVNSSANTSAAPANPNTNIKGGALGYFAAYAVSKKSIRVK